MKFNFPQATRFLTLPYIALLVVAIILGTSGPATGEPPADGPSSSASTSERGLDVSIKEARESIVNGDANANQVNKQHTNPPRYNYVWIPVSQFSGCGPDLSPDAAAWRCAPHPDFCDARTGNWPAGRV